MIMPRIRAALVATVSAATLLVPAAAVADTVTVRDPKADSWSYTFDDQTGAEEYTRAGSQVNADVTRTVVRHTTGRVVVRSQYVELRRASRVIFYGVQLRTNEAVRRDVYIDTFMSARGDAMLTKPNGDMVRCRGFSHAIDYAADTVTVTLPRRCLSLPRWVQVGVGVGGITDAGDMFLDDAQGDRPTDRLGWSSRVRKG